ncbi:TrbG/VirB9 family P-type conjugative transfer protein [Ruegeria sp.]|uniref:TrbG/VirB9 family P-type conjugative transfer protein n=1 Tax=Ruegeria sp. TaxID=1879320 RepID=UPI003B001C48
MTLRHRHTRPLFRAALLAVLIGMGGVAASPTLACDAACQERIDKLAGEAKARDQSVGRGPNNTVVVQHGAGIPVLKCRPLHFCTIQLQPGEVLREDLALGDTVLWLAELRVSGTDLEPHVRVVVKPDAAATRTSLLIPTDRRFYDIQLVRSDTEYTPVMAFTYPAEVAAATRAKVAKDAALRAERQAQVAIEEARQSLKVGTREVFSGDLDFRFDIRGKAPFKPTRVFTDGRKTWIDLPDRYRGERPVFLADGPGQANQAVVNSRWQGNRLEIDRVITGGALVIGVGRQAQKVILRRMSR